MPFYYVSLFNWSRPASNGEQLKTKTEKSNSQQSLSCRQNLSILGYKKTRLFFWRRTFCPCVLLQTLVHHTEKYFFCPPQRGGKEGKSMSEGVCNVIFLRRKKVRQYMDCIHTWAWGIRGHGGEGNRYPPPEGQSPNPPSSRTLYWPPLAPRKRRPPLCLDFFAYGADRNKQKSNVP